MGVSGRLQRRLSSAVVLAVLAGGLAFGVAPASAGSSVGSFEIDGNLIDSPAGEPIDWSTPPPNLTNFTDPSGRTDDGFGQGSHEEEPGGWTCVTGSVPGKDDIKSGQIAFRRVNGDQFLYVNFTRAAVNGDAHMDYEFAQSSAGSPGTGCSAIPQRSQGDLLITFDTANGGASISVGACTWNGTAFIGTFDCSALGPQGGIWDGAVNIPNTIPGHTAGDFGEAAINLSQSPIGAITCGEFAKVYMKTRSSTSINAELKDRTQPKDVLTGECPKSNLAKAVRDASSGGTFATTATAKPGDTLEYRLTYTNTGQATATNVQISDVIQAHQTFLSCSDSCTTDGPPVTTVSWTVASVPPGTTVVRTFQVKLDASFPNGTTSISNVGVVCTHEEVSCTSSPPTTTTVTAAPASSLAKAVRDVTSGGSFATTASAAPGDTLEYRLTYTNSGTGTASNVVLSDTIQAHQTFLSCSDSCTTDGPPVTKVSWSLGNVAPGTTVVRTFQVKLDAVFPAGTTNVANVGVACTTEEGCKSSNTTTTTVTAAPKLALAKQADATGTVVAGDKITYTLTATNSGNADAASTTITDPVPAGTQFASCSDSCTQSGSTVTWSIGTLAAGASRSVTLTVTVLDSAGCKICNIAHVASPSENAGAAVDSNQVCVDATPGPDPSGAHASGSAIGAHVQASALKIDQTITPVSSSVSGVGSDGHSAGLLNLNLPDSNAGLAHIGLLETATASKVTREPAAADDLTSADTADVKLLKGVGGVYAVEANVVRAVAHTTATGSDASYTSEGSTITGLKVAGLAQASIKPNETIDLPDTLFGPNSYVVIDQEVGSTALPSAGQTSGGTYAADLTVTMIRVHTDDLPLTGGKPDPVDITVAKAVSHADFPQTRLCTSAPTQAVSGHAFIAAESTDPAILPILSGFVSIPASGGHGHQDVASALLPEPDGSVVTTGVADSDSTGARGPTSSTSTSYAEAANVCLLRNNGACTISATAVKSQSASTADGTTASSTDGGTQLVGLMIGSVPIAVTPAPNTVIELPGIGFVILNEQTCDNGTQATHSCSGTTHSGLTVRAIHVVVLKGALGLLPGADVVVAEAHSDATYVR